jgi:hypothetical protein
MDNFGGVCPDDVSNGARGKVCSVAPHCQYSAHYFVKIVSKVVENAVGAGSYSICWLLYTHWSHQQVVS